MQRNIVTKSEPATPGVIDTIAEGFSIALVQPLLMLVPMLLDLHYWMGWRVSLGAVTDRLSEWLVRQDATSVDEVTETLQRAGDRDATQILSLLVPSLVSDIDRTELYRAVDRQELAPSSWGLALVILAAAFLGSALLVMLFTVPLADAALERERSVRMRLRAIAVAALRLLGFVALLAGLAVLLLGPLLLGALVLMAAGFDAGPLATSIAVLAGIVAYLLLWFVPDAIVASEVGPVRAIYLSVAVVRGFFWQTLGLTSASMVISLGLGEIWRQLVDSAPGLLLAVIANAFVASSLALASILFYSRRIRLLRPEFAP